jgi:hypothetical protein
MLRLSRFVGGQWHEDVGKSIALLNPATEEVLAETNTGGIDFAAVLEYARTVGRSALPANALACRVQDTETGQYRVQSFRNDRPETIGWLITKQPS